MMCPPLDDGSVLSFLVPRPRSKGHGALLEKTRKVHSPPVRHTPSLEVVLPNFIMEYNLGTVRRSGECTAFCPSLPLASCFPFTDTFLGPDTYVYRAQLFPTSQCVLFVPPRCPLSSTFPTPGLLSLFTIHPPRFGPHIELLAFGSVFLSVMVLLQKPVLPPLGIRLIFDPSPRHLMRQKGPFFPLI